MYIVKDLTGRGYVFKANKDEILNDLKHGYFIDFDDAEELEDWIDNATTGDEIRSRTIKIIKA
jgi:hypothetical protein